MDVRRATIRLDLWACHACHRVTSRDTHPQSLSSHPKNHGGRFTFPRRIRTLYPPGKRKPRRPFLFSLARLGPRSSAAGPTKEGFANDSKSRAEAPVRSALNQFPVNGMPRPTQKNIQLTKIKSLSLTREGTDATPRATLLESPRGSGATPIGCAHAHPLAK